MFTYLTLNQLPSVPDEFVAAAMEIDQSFVLDTGRNHSPDWYKNRTIRDGEQQWRSTYCLKYEIPGLLEWVRQHVYPEAQVANFNVTSADIGTYHGPHTDATRRYVLIYPLDSGGPETRTVFFKEANKPLVRTEKKAVFDDLSDLEVIDRADFPCYRWSLMDAMIVHGVEKIKTRRMAFHIDVQENVWF